MNLKTLLGLLVVLLGLSAYVYFGIQKPEEGREERERAQRELFRDVSVKKATEIWMTTPAVRGELLLKKDPSTERWFIESPIRDLASASTMEALIEALDTVEQKRVIQEKPESLAPFGLEKPRLSVQFKIPEGELTKEYRVEVGDKNPDQSLAFAKSSLSAAVVTIEPELEAYTSKGLDDYRERDIAKLNFSDVVEVQIQPTSGEPIVVTKEGESWKIKQPFELEASGREVENYLAKISSLRATEFVSERPKLRPTGLENPMVKVKLLLKEEKVEQRDREGKHKGRFEITVGRVGKEAQVTTVGPEGVNEEDPFEFFIQTSSAPAIYEIGKFQAEGLLPKVGSFVDRDVLNLAISSIERIKAVRGEESRELEKVGTGRWKLLKPTAIAADNQTVERILSALNGTVAQDVIGVGARAQAEWIPATPLMRLEVYSSKDAGAEPITITVGKKLPEKKSVSLMLSDRPAVYELAEAEMERLWPTLSDLQLKKLFDLSSEGEASWSSVALTTPDGTVTVRKRGEKVTAEVKAQTGTSRSVDDQATLKTVLTKLNNLRVTDFLDAARVKVNSAVTGFDQPVLVTQAQDQSGVVISTEYRFGQKLAGKDLVYVQSKDPELLFTVNAPQVESLKMEIEQLIRGQTVEKGS